MKKPKIEAEEQQPRKVIRADKAPDDRILAGRGRSFQVAPRDRRGGRRSGHGIEAKIPDASGSGLRRRDQDAVDGAMAGARLEALAGVRCICPERCLPKGAIPRQDGDYRGDDYRGERYFLSRYRLRSCVRRSVAPPANPPMPGVFSSRLLCLDARLLGRGDGLRRCRGFAREPQRFQLRHIVEHGLVLRHRDRTCRSSRRRRLGGGWGGGGKAILI